MENIPTENLEVEEKGRQVSEYCLRLPTILRHILENFSNRELIRISLVNKLWNYEARSVMKNRGKVRANLSRGGFGDDDPRRQLVAFASDLEKMNVVPFTGLHLSIYQDTVCKSFTKGSLDLPCKVIRDRVPWKHFSVKFCHGWDKCKDCPVVMLAKRILEEHCGTLEDLHLGYSTQEFLRPVFEDRSMPRLKFLTIESHEFKDLLPSSYVKVLVSRAPNLQELHVDRFVDLNVNVLEGSTAVLVPYKFTLRPLLKPICEGLIKPLRAKTIEIFIGEEAVDPEKLNSFVPMLLEASRTTITEFRMDLLFAVPLMCYGICLENVTKLKIRLCDSEYLEDIEPSILELPKGLDFTRVFPKVNEVTIDEDYSLDFPSDVVSAFLEQATAMLSRALPDRAINIKILQLSQMCSVEMSTLRLLAQIFPDVRTLHTNDSQRWSLALLREHFPRLEEVEGNPKTNTGANLDEGAHSTLTCDLCNFEARSVIRKRGNLRAHFSRGRYDDAEECPCQELQAFASDLEKMRVVPFSGPHFPIDHRDVCKSVSKGSLHPSYKVILDRLHWKQLLVQFGSPWKNSKDCPALVLIKQILEDYCEVLEALSLGFANDQFLGPILKDRTLPCLKTLAIQSWQDTTANGSLTSSFIKALVSSAPNLQELHVNAAVDLTVNILEGSSAVLVPKFRFHPLFDPICEDLTDSIRSDEMAILVHTERIDPELLNRFIPRVLEASRTTLSTLIMDYLFAVPLMCYGICLENVTTLEIHMNSDRLDNIEPWILALPKGLDFTRVFPKLNQVTILDDYVLNFSSDMISAFVEQGTAVLSRALPDRATNIKHLDLERCGAIDDSTLPLLAQMFPDVKTVHTKSEHEGALFEDLREHFLCLEKVTESENEIAF